MNRVLANIYQCYTYKIPKTLKISEFSESFYFMFENNLKICFTIKIVEDFKADTIFTNVLTR